jgi:hypothetical protein
MTKKALITGKVEIKFTYTRVADPVDKSKVKSRGPNEIGQAKDITILRLGRIEEDDFRKRLKAIKNVLKTGKVPAEMKGGSPKVKDATLSKAKGDLTKANKKIAELEAELKKVDTEKEERKEKDPE